MERRKTWVFEVFNPADNGATLAHEPAGHHVFRAAVLSIVLTFAVGPNAALLCAVWCHPEEARTSDCQHQRATTSPQVTGEDSCRTVPASATSFVREDARRGAARPDSQPAVAVPGLQVARPPGHMLRAYRLAPSPGAQSPPVLIALRL